MSKKGIIIGNFVLKTKILSFLEVLKFKFNVNLDRVFVYEIEDNLNEYLVTFKANDKDRYISVLTSSTIMHVKNNCLFSINALNKLIDEQYKNSNNKNNNEIEIDWNLYKDKLIITTNGQLNIKNITKIEDKCSFLS